MVQVCRSVVNQRLRLLGFRTSLTSLMFLSTGTVGKKYLIDQEGESAKYWVRDACKETKDRVN